MKHYDLPFIDKAIEQDEEFQSILVLLEDAVVQCSRPETSNRAMAKLCHDTYQNMQHIREAVKELKKRRNA